MIALKRALLVGVLFVSLAGLDRPVMAQPAATPPAGQRLTHETLLVMLQNLGYSVKTTQSTAGTPMYGIPVTVENWDMTISVALSGNGNNIWLNAALLKVTDAKPIPADILRKMLERNQQLSPCHFKIVAASSMLYLSHPTPNLEVTPTLLRAELDFFIQSIKSTEPLWNEAKWSTPSAPTAAPLTGDALRLQGTWRVVEIWVDGKKGTPEQIAAANLRMTLSGMTVRMEAQGRDYQATLRLDVNQAPRHLDIITTVDLVDLGIYELEGDTLRWCYRVPKVGGRPASLQPGPDCTLVILQRVSATAQAR